MYAPSVINEFFIFYNESDNIIAFATVTAVLKQKGESENKNICFFT
jgi:hypothetical protein